MNKETKVCVDKIKNHIIIKKERKTYGSYYCSIYCNVDNCK